MSKYVPDISSHRWVIISQQRVGRPKDGKKKKSKKPCPFCPGNENLTPPEVFRYGSGENDKKGWKVRVIPNKFKITDQHEVIIHGPSHEKDIEDFSHEQISLIFKAYRERYNFYKDKGQVLIFCNHGKHAGASLKHPHSQLVVIPRQINLDALYREPLNNIVDKNKFFNVYCPEFSQWPYEVWFAPKEEGKVFGEISNEQIDDLSIILKKTLRQIEKVYKRDFSKESFDYNYYIYPKENWYLRVIPRFIDRAGFELGTGLSVNIIDPYNASLELKGLDEATGSVLKRLKRY